MARIDPEQERRRLAEFYAGQLDGELEKVAGEAYELSQLAREMLRMELNKRGLNAELAVHAPAPVKKVPQPGDAPFTQPAETEIVEQKFPETYNEHHADRKVAIRIFRDLPQALLAKGCLESAGIDCALVDDNTVRIDWFYSNAIGGIKLLVKADDVADANQVLNQPIPEHLEVAGVGDYEQPKCPKCGSLDVNFRELDPATYLGLGGSYWGVFIPIPIHRHAWSCHSCSVEWEDDGMPPAESAT